MRLKILGAHSIEALGFRLPGLLVDDAIALDAGSVSAGLSLLEQKNLRAVLLTHHHFDHCRDLVTLCMNVSLWDGQLAVYGLQSTLEIVMARLLDGTLYVNGASYPSRDKPSLKMEVVEPYREFEIGNYRVLPFPVRHSVPSVGFYLMSKDGATFFYTGDTGPGFGEQITEVSPKVIFAEVSGPEVLASRLVKVGHLSPNMLMAELRRFEKVKGYIPKVVAVHLNPVVEDQVRGELAEVAEQLDANIILGREDLVIGVDGETSG